MFKEKLKELRLEDGLTQAQLADAFGCTKQAIHNYEKGICEPNLDTLVKMANFFGISADYLIVGSDESERASRFSENRLKNIISIVKEVDAHIAEIKKLLGGIYHE